MVTQNYDNSCRTTFVCVDSYEDKIPRGRIYNSFLDCGITFVGVMSFLLSMEKLFEEMNFPQDFSSKRSFKSNADKADLIYTDENVKVGKLATFSIKLLFRQNASWQGLVSWSEGKSEESFRSTLELLVLMDSALSEVAAIWDLNFL